MTASLLRIAVKVLLSLTLAVIVGALVVLIVLPRAVGGAALTVLTGSMAPTIPVGSVVVVQPVDPQTLTVGDVITYAVGADANSTHRITAVHRTADSLSFTTKGDANPAEDLEPVTAAAVRGKLLLTVPHLGMVKEAISFDGGTALMVLLLLASYAAWQFGSAARDRWSQSTPIAAMSELPASALRLQMLVITVRHVDFAGLAPATVARLLRMELLDEGDSTFTLAVVRECEQLDELAQLLSPFDPVSCSRSEVLVVPGCGPGGPLLTATPIPVEGSADVAA